MVNLQRWDLFTLSQVGTTPFYFQTTHASPKITSTRAEDRAPVGTDPSAVSGAKTEWGGTMPPSAIRDWHQCAKSTGKLPVAYAAIPRLTTDGSSTLVAAELR
jgi:hypothetical protein